jgi:conjugative relaxase-like TrwC/TraI family protein
MMSISPMGAGSTIENYYCNLAREDYYTKGGEPPGYWFGKGSTALALGTMVTQDQIRQTLHGFAPDGTSLVQGAGARHRAGWDCTFSAPKSVSLTWAVAGIDTRHAIAAAHARSVEAALQFIERNACHARRGQAGIREEKVSGMVAACFEHGTSREGDPQLHTHCLLHNLAQRADGSWGAIESGWCHLSRRVGKPDENDGLCRRAGP